MKVLVFAFADTIAEAVTDELSSPFVVQKLLLNSSQGAIATFIKTTDFTQFTHCIGIGVYSGRDQDKIRIESSCTNKFRNQGDANQRINIPYFLPADKEFKIAHGIGNSWCNLVSYTLIKLSPDMPYTFLHIPKKYNVRQAARSIDAAIANTRMRYT